MGYVPMEIARHCCRGIRDEPDVSGLPVGSFGLLTEGGERG